MASVTRLGASSALTLLALAAATGDVMAQSRSWVPWYEPGLASVPAPRPAAQARPSAAPNTIRAARPALAPRAAVYSSGSVFGGQIAQPKSQVKYPAFLDGGARPSISPSTPPQVAFSGYSAGSIVVDTGGRALYYVTSSNQAYRYPISVGREGFTWRGTERISRVASWPDWRPPAEMRQRDPNLPEVMSGGVNNPLGAKALYLGNTLYRIHGTNDSRTIGYAASSGCFRMMNSHVTHLAGLAGTGTTVHVLDSLSSKNRVASR
jgi:lipoprotein-anchoring transpeptidase ErfK/SrfK